MNRNKRTARRALVARVESLEGRISLSTTSVGITKYSGPGFALSAFHLTTTNTTTTTTTTGGGGITKYSGPGFALSGGHS